MLLASIQRSVGIVEMQPRPSLISEPVETCQMMATGDGEQTPSTEGAHAREVLAVTKLLAGHMRPKSQRHAQ